jgi:hypothetical protein
MLTPRFSVVQEDSLQLLFDRLGAKAGNLRVGPGMVKYGWQDGPVFNLDDGEFDSCCGQVAARRWQLKHVNANHLN